ncbi:uncharacterized protein A4U43_C02F12730 [Asparagus officinalis]|uniref:Uncharacterized protein n=1 Tax=Asparagus officinalis TaxID=4686 RepID=A0A5P1FMV9_ASPOF|nr:uncharacterized protein A4U43_C02F12730 [Asparagus officinalis]
MISQLIQQSKDRSKAIRQQRRILEPITAVTDINAVIELDEEADRVYTVDNPDPNLLVNLDLDGVLSVEEMREEQREEEALHAGSLQEIPSDTEDSLTLEFEQDVLPPSPRVNAHSKSGYENIEDLFELDDSLYFDQQFEIKLKEEDESDVACF